MILINSNDVLHYCKLKYRKHKLYIKYGIIFIIILLFLLLFIVIYNIYNVFPEVSMILSSQCNNPIRSWNGKLFEFSIYSSNYIEYRYNLSIHNEFNYKVNSNSNNNSNRNITQYTSPNIPIILLGSHHKTGTYVSRKIFSKICEHFSWCCIFHTTKDSINAIRETLQNEYVHIIAHNQWIWRPEEIIKLLPYKRDYRFIHFVRNPFLKIISSHNYHSEGTERWTRKSLYYNNICDSNVVLRSLYDHNRMTRSYNKFNDNNSSTITSMHVYNTNFVEKSSVFEYCKSVHLCETCCRREHEYNETVYQLRSNDEYLILCKYISRIDQSLYYTLSTKPIQESLAIESCIDYYENLKMSRILNYTFNDPKTLTIDLDKFENNYELYIDKIIDHINLDLYYNNNIINDLIYKLYYYNIKESFFYNMIMKSSFFKHIDSKKNKKLMIEKYLTNIMKKKDILKLYQPVLELLHGIYYNQ